MLIMLTFTREDVSDERNTLIHQHTCSSVSNKLKNHLSCKKTLSKVVGDGCEGKIIVKAEAA